MQKGENTLDNLSPKAKLILDKLCEYYNRTGKKSIYTSDIPLNGNCEKYFEELDSYGYVIFNNTIAPNVDLLSKCIEYAKTF